MSDKLQGLKFKGYVCGVIAAVCYGLNPLFVVNMYNEGIGVTSALFYRYSFSVVFLLFMMLAKRVSFRVSKAEVAPILVMGLLFVLSSLFLFDSYQYMDVGIASTLLFVYPVLVALINTVLFHESITLPTVASLGVCCVGVALLCKSDAQTTVSLWGILLVMLSSLSYAIYIIGIKRSALSNYSAVKLTFYSILVGTLFLAVKLRFLTELDAIPSLLSLGCGVGLAVFPTIISLVLMSVSVKYVGATPAAILGSFEPITGVVVGVLAFHEILTAQICLGMMLILLSVLLIMGEKRILQLVRKQISIK